VANPIKIQTALFQAIKHRLPENFSFVHEIAELLGISYDSAYRRIRGDKPLTLVELIKLNEKFGLSVDTFLNVETNNVVFNCHAVDKLEYAKNYAPYTIFPFDDDIIADILMGKIWIHYMLNNNEV
jgi:plasmid maintenance system antidote protein VapI